jgi:hypothetical protein
VTTALLVTGTVGSGKTSTVGDVLVDVTGETVPRVAELVLRGWMGT